MNAKVANCLLILEIGKRLSHKLCMKIILYVNDAFAPFFLYSID